MKSLNKILPLAFLCLGLSACLDEEDPLTGRDTEASPNLIEFYSEDPAEHPSAERIYTEVTKSFEIVPEANFDVVISYSGKNNAPEDIVVGVKVDEAALKAFNNKIIADAREAAMAGIEDPDEAKEAADDAEAHADVYDMMPANLYSVPSEITIKRGERRATLPITVKPALFDFAFKYGLPLTITTASQGVISGNFSTVIYSIGAKNKYDGIYTIQAGSNITRNTATGPDPSLSGDPAGEDIALVTLSANTVSFEPVWANGTSIGGIDNTILRINPDNTVTVTSSNPSLKNTPGKENKYDPATKTFTINIDWGSGAATRVLNYVMKYNKSR
ncbi:hypothetical protein AAE02nite_03920 [Adhaeribacter aerolatus]|uniref:DUF1735 domain-containing protein n=1 Tax=Adhaeribacter aerolatus TaxID=670289 RepID=A0A512ASP0_9BACT|nr:DUF1735 domain-containing protein [Adhaeribacter aerolatus]GEO02728.1 hypothetical protein AAE02nite_03920 [Adhaeribacter aerolatus]